MSDRPLIEQMAVAYATEIEELRGKVEKLQAVLADALLVLEVQFGKEAKPGSLIYQIREALSHEEETAYEWASRVIIAHEETE